MPLVVDFGIPSEQRGTSVVAHSGARKGSQWEPTPEHSYVHSLKKIFKILVSWTVFNPQAICKYVEGNGEDFSH